MDAQEQFDALFDLQDADSSSEDMDALLKGNVVAHRVIGPSSANITKTYHVELDTGITAFFKPLNEVRGLYAHAFGHTKVSATLAEVAAWRIAHALGSLFEELVPTVVARFIDQFDQNAPGALSTGRLGIDSTLAPMTEAPDQVNSAAFFDALIGQQDRHGGNYLWDATGSRLSLIDHGFSLGLHQHLVGGKVFVDHRWNTGSFHLNAPERAALEEVRDSVDGLGLSGWIEPERVAALRSRAERMLAADSILPPGTL